MARFKPSKLSQRDKRWKGIPLGFSNDTTIGSHGCTIAIIAMASDLTPKEVNDKLKNVMGYANKNLVIWGKVEKAIPWMRFVFRGWAYDNKKVLEAIKKNGFCLAEVSATPIGSPKGKHWVLMIGDYLVLDPWTGEVQPTNKWRFTGYAIIDKIGVKPDSSREYKGYNLDDIPDEALKIFIDQDQDVKNGDVVSKDHMESMLKTREDLIKTGLRKKVDTMLRKYKSLAGEIFSNW